MEEITSQTAEALSGLPLAGAYDAGAALRAARRSVTRATAGSVSPLPAEISGTIEDALTHLGAAIGHLGAGSESLRGYLHDFGMPAELGEMPMPPGETMDDKVRVSMLQEARGWLQEPQPLYEKDTLGAAVHPYGRPFREMLCLPGQRDWVLCTLEDLLHAPSDQRNLPTNKARLLSEAGYIAVEQCYPELIKLAAQTTNISLAARAEDILFAAYGIYSGVPDKMKQYLSAHLLSYIDRHVAEWHRYDENATSNDSRRIVANTTAISRGMDHVSGVTAEMVHRRASMPDIFGHLVNLAKNGSPITTRFAKTMLEHVSESDSASERLLRFLEGFHDQHVTELSGDVVHAWHIGCSRDAPAAVRLRNLQAIFALEQHARGAAGELYGRLRLRNFARLPDELLRDTYDLLQQTPGRLQSYTLWYIATSSHNYAMEPEITGIAAAYQAAKLAGHTIIPAEFSAPEDFATIEDTVRMAGWGQANDAVVQSHGMGDGITPHHKPRTAYDRPEEPVRILSADILKAEANIAHSLGRVVRRLGTITIAACSVAFGGENGSFAWHVNQTAKRRVVAPSTAVQPTLRRPVPNPITGRLELDVLFTDGGIPHKPTVFKTPET